MPLGRFGCRSASSAEFSPSGKRLSLALTVLPHGVRHFDCVESLLQRFVEINVNFGRRLLQRLVFGRRRLDDIRMGRNRSGIQQQDGKDHRHQTGKQPRFCVQWITFDLGICKKALAWKACLQTTGLLFFGKRILQNVMKYTPERQ